MDTTSHLPMLKTLQSKLKRTSALDLRAGLQQLEQVLRENRPVFNRLLLLQSRYNHLEAQFAQKLLTNEAYQVERSQLNKAVISFIDELEAADLAQTELTVPTSYDSPRLPFQYQRFSWQEQTPFFLEAFDTGGNEVFRSYEEPIWSARLEQGVFQMTNQTEPSAVRYHYLNINERDMVDVPVAVEVKVQSGQKYPNPSGGLLFCFDRSSAFYYAFIIDNQRQFTLWRRGEGGYRTIFASRSTKIIPSEFNRIGVIRTDPYIYLFINDEFERKVEDKVLLTGDSGIIAVGQGSFTFDNLAFFDLPY